MKWLLPSTTMLPLMEQVRCINHLLNLSYVQTIPAESVAVTAAPLIQQVVARASNRLFLGLPACRNPEIIQIATEVSKRMMLNVFLSQILPSSLKQCVFHVYIILPMLLTCVHSTIGRYLSTVPVIAKRYQTILDPILTDRRRKLEDEANGHGYYDKPDDMLMWMLEHPTGQKASLKDMTMRMLQLDFATINSTAQVRSSSTRFHLNFLNVRLRSLSTFFIRSL